MIEGFRKGPIEPHSGDFRRLSGASDSEAGLHDSTTLFGPPAAREKRKVQPSQVGMVNIPVPKSLKRQMSFWVTLINDAGLAHSAGGGPLGSHGGVP